MSLVCKMILDITLPKRNLYTSQAGNLEHSMSWAGVDKFVCDKDPEDLDDILNR